MTETITQHEEVLAWWLGEVDEDGLAPREAAARWWKKDPAFDRRVVERFQRLHAAIAGGEHEDWQDRPRSRLAYIIVLDQLSRNIYRDTSRMFASDEQALAATLAGLDREIDRRLQGDGRCFFYLPLMHSEQLEHQDRCIAHFSAYREQLDGALRHRVGDNLAFAKKHREIVARFGRFPHRNRILGRRSTAEELAFLELPGSSF